jgi:hypothetical protein
MYFCPSLIISPQDEVGGCMPSPRKLRIDSVAMAPAIPRLATTITGAMTLGSTWVKMILQTPMPDARAATMKSFSLMEMTEHRRKSPDHFKGAHDHPIDPFPKIAGKETKNPSDEEGYHDGGNPNEERDPCAVENPAQEIPPQMIRSEKMLNGRGGEDLGNIHVIGVPRCEERGKDSC